METTEFAHQMPYPGMLHGRMVRAPIAGAVPFEVDEPLIDGIAAQVVWKPTSSVSWRSGSGTRSKRARPRGDTRDESGVSVLLWNYHDNDRDLDSTARVR